MTLDTMRAPVQPVILVKDYYDLLNDYDRFIANSDTVMHRMMRRLNGFTEAMNAMTLAPEPSPPRAFGGGTIQTPVAPPSLPVETRNRSLRYKGAWEAIEALEEDIRLSLKMVTSPADVALAIAKKMTLIDDDGVERWDNQ